MFIEAAKTWWQFGVQDPTSSLPAGVYMEILGVDELQLPNSGC